MKLLRVILVKPSKYGLDGHVERFKKGFMPNATLYHIASLTPKKIGNYKTVIHTIDEYVWCNLKYLDLLQHQHGCMTLVAIVGVQSHQFHRALDLAAFAKNQGVENCVIGGPHVMTCDTSSLQFSGVSFAISEAENIWVEILKNAAEGELEPVYGVGRRWAPILNGPTIVPPSSEDLERYWAPMLGIYPVRGCPYSCNFCSVIKISGRQVRSESIDATIRSLKRAKEAGVNTVMFVSDNFNKYPEAENLLLAIIEEDLGIRYFCQCDTQIASQHKLVELLGRANCFEVFVGVESFDRKILKAANKLHNHPKKYLEIIRICKEFGIRAHFSNIIGFPNQKESDINEHVECLKQLKPPVASFYILTPIPGTDQYNEYYENDLLLEKNLDRYDATYPTFAHPYISKDKLLENLYKCYVQYNRFLLRNVKLDDETKRLAIFNRFTAENRIHPMAGGIDRVKLDYVDDYLPIRLKYFSVNTVPLPHSLNLSVREEAINRNAKPYI